MDDWLAQRAGATPDATALLDPTTDETVTYATLDEAVDRTAGQLAALGVSAGDHVGILMETRRAFVRLVHAVMRLDAVLVPVHARETVATVGAQLDRADVTTLVCGPSTRDVALAAGEDLPLAIVDGDAPDATALRTVAPAPVTAADWSTSDPQVIMFTSGTTGAQKAVVLTAGNLLASAGASAVRLGVDPEDRWHLCLPMYHMGGLAPVVRSTLYGTAVVLQRGFDAVETLSLLDRFDATCVSLVPTQLQRLLDADELPDSLRFVLLGGAPASRSLLERCVRRDVPVCPTYGTTETASQIATVRPGRVGDDLDTVGTPLFGTSVTVVDDSGSVCGPGERGELVVSGPTVTPGYYDAPDATAEAFGPDGFETGDVGYRDERGRLYVCNRVDDRIVTGGENVDPGEITDALLAHDEIESCAVVGLDDEEWGQRIAALLVASSPVSVDEIRAHCRGHLADFKCPKTIAFADALPRTASGTVDRSAVRARLSE
jgi:O-succinylbenzoic acid--CoA ligase